MTKFIHRRKMSVLLALSVSPLPFLASGAFAAGALPTGGNFVTGSGTIAGTGTRVTVTQSTTRGIIDWSGFSIGRGNAVQINNGAGATLNRVTGLSPSSIAGSLTSTGSTYLINENGVVVMPTGKIVTGGGFVASTRDTGNDAFMRGGNLQFTGTSAGVVTNQGSITSNTGDVVLIGKSVSNSGRISALKGTAGIIAGDDVLLQPSGTGLQIRVNSGSGDATTSGAMLAAQAIIDAAGGNAYALAGNNGGLVRANGTTTIGGHVWLSAAGAARVTGTLQAQNADGSGGAIDVQGTDIRVSGTLNANDYAQKGNGGNIKVGSPEVASTTISGRLTARAGKRGGNGGSVETSGEVLNINGIKVDTSAGHGPTGNWTLDPYNVMITSGATLNNGLSAGTFTPSGNDSIVSVSDIQTALQTTNVTVTTRSGGTQSGDITVAVPVAWSANTLMLDAFHSIIVSAPMSASGTAGLTLKTNDGGAGGDLSFNRGNVSFANTSEALTINGAAYTLLGSMADVQAINSNLSRNYALANSLDASTTTNWLPLGTNAADSITNGSAGFTGTFEGLGNTISNLKVNLSSTTNYVGLFGAANGTIRDIGVVGGSVSGNNYVGGLVGVSHGTIVNAYAGDMVGGSTYAGGLVGYTDGTITNSYATGAVSGWTHVGGLAGHSQGATITNSYATGAVAGLTNTNSTSIGGLVGFAQNGAISSSFATGAVTGTGFGSDYGGLVGYASGVAITNTFASGIISGRSDVGGLVGSMDNGSVTSSYARGLVNSTLVNWGGGLVGSTSTPGGTVFTSAYYDTQTSAQTKSVGGLAQTTAQLQGILPAGFDPAVWGTAPGQYPWLRWHPTAIDVIVGLTGSVIKTYDGTLLATLGQSNYTLSGVSPADQNGIMLTVNGTPITMPTSGMFSTKNVGTGLAVTVTGLALNQPSGGNYVLDSATVSGNIGTINPAMLTYTANAAESTYGSPLPSFSGSLTGFVNGETLANATTGTLAWTSPATSSSNVGSYAINGSGLAANNGNYVFVQAPFNATALTINPAALTLAADDKVQTYGGTQPALTYTAAGLVNGDTTASFTTQPTLSTAPANSHAGTYPIMIGGAVDPNYTITYVNGMLTINPAALMLTADDKSQIYGGTQPALTYTAAGLVNGDTTASFMTQPTLSTVAANSHAGTYPITIGGAVDPDYTITYVNGMLTINPAALLLTADNKSQTYGGSQPALTYTAAGLVNGDTTASLTTQPTLSTAPANSNAGSYAIAIGGAYNPNYSISYVNGTLTINPAALTLAADNKSQIYGGAQPALTYTAAGLVNGDTTASLTTPPALSTVPANSRAGTYPIDISGAVDPNYTITYVNGTLTINQAVVQLLLSGTRVYDGTTNAPAGILNMVNLVPGDQVTLSGTGVLTGNGMNNGTSNPGFASIGTLSLSGADAANYTLANITTPVPVGTGLAQVATVSGSNMYNTVHISFAGVDFSGAKFQGVNFAGLDLSGANLSGANLLNANLAGMNLANVNLSGANLNGVNLAGTNLSGANLSKANLNGANLTGANLNGANLKGANLNKTTH